MRLETRPAADSLASVLSLPIASTPSTWTKRKGTIAQMASPSTAVVDPTQPSPSALQRGYSATSAMDLPPNSHQSQPYSSSFNSNSNDLAYTSSLPYDDRTTQANTVANAGPGSNPYAQHLQPPASHNNSLAVPPQQQQQGRFTEEWDASQRGSSIIDGHHGANMQRSTSAHSFNAGDDNQLPIRGNTLKKKNSVRRTGSLKRSSSRRSMRAGSVKSLALQSSSDPDEAHSAFHCPVPTSGNPADVLSDRFQCTFCSIRYPLTVGKVACSC